MPKEQFVTSIDASPAQVWEILWTDASYRQWTSVFTEGSHAVSDWKEGSKILFLNGQGRGMVSRIAAIRPPEFMSFEHLGEIKDGKEDITSERVKQWAGATENYTLTATDSGTRLTVEMDIHADFAEMFRNIWPKALNRIKELSETT